jgi:hypothetical protein
LENFSASNNATSKHKHIRLEEGVVDTARDMNGAGLELGDQEFDDGSVANTAIPPLAVVSSGTADDCVRVAVENSSRDCPVVPVGEHVEERHEEETKTVP